MFGMGGTEILVILIVALLFLGPDKLPEAAKSISKGIRDLRKQTREFQETIEADERFGGAIRDLKSALNGEDPRPRPRPRPLPETPADDLAAAVGASAMSDAERAQHMEGTVPPELIASGDAANRLSAEVAAAPSADSTVRLPDTAGDGVAVAGEDSKELAAMIKPVEGTIAKGSASGHG